MTEVTRLEVEQIVVGNNDRTVFAPEALEELAANIARNGLIQPITVRALGEGERIVFCTELFELVAGERRLRACKLLGWTEIPAIVADLTAEEAAAVMLAENVARADLDPMDEAHAYQARIDRYGWSVQRIATAAGVSPDRVQRRLTLLTLRDDLQKMVATGHLPVGHAELVARLDGNRQGIVIKVLACGKPMALSAFRMMVSDLGEQQNQEALFDTESFWVQQAAEPEDARGKNVLADLPSASFLPQPEIKGSDSTGTAISRYAQDLSRLGFLAEAGAISRLLVALAAKNFCAMPRLVA